MDQHRFRHDRKAAGMSPPVIYLTTYSREQWRILQQLRVRYRLDHDRWSERELAHLNFMRWLVQTGRLDGMEGLEGLEEGRGEEMDVLTAPLPPGTVAPDFSLARTPRGRLALHSLRGKAVILVFYPMDWEPVSREQLALYQDHEAEFNRLDARLLGISVDPVGGHAAFARDARIRFPLLADAHPRGAVARSYRVYRESQGVSARALFVLDRRGIIRFSRAYPDLLNPGVDELLTTLEAMAGEDESAEGR
jgi:peroxiredoxin